MDFHATLSRLFGVTPSHCVMPGSCAVYVPETCDHREMPRVEVECRHELTNLLTVKHFGAPAEVFVDLCTLTERAYGGVGVGERQLATMGIHDVEVEFIGQPFKHPY
ncbi:hypothetical protein D9M71_118660 [compost metagenome]